MEVVNIGSTKGKSFAKIIFIKHDTCYKDHNLPSPKNFKYESIMEDMDNKKQG